MICFKDFIDNKIKITWKLINIGYIGSNTFKNELSTEEILNYAIKCSCDDKIQDTNLELLACEYKENIEQIDMYIKKLADSEDSNFEREFRKWRAIYVKIELKKQSNYWTGLIHLNDIWSKFDFPNDSPYILQGVNNNITPKEYYTEENYIYLYEKIIKWLQIELEYLRN